MSHKLRTSGRTGPEKAGKLYAEATAEDTSDGLQAVATLWHDGRATFELFDRPTGRILARIEYRPDGETIDLPAGPALFIEPDGLRIATPAGVIVEPVE